MRRFFRYVVIGFVVAAGVAMVVVVAFGLRCPIELSVVSNEPIDIVDEAGEPMRYVTLRAENRTESRLEFDVEAAKVEARIGDRWVMAPNLWTIRTVAARGRAVGWSPKHLELSLLVPEQADACRFRLKYRRAGSIRLPLGIRDPWARWEAPSTPSLRAQRLISRISTPLYDWLWPVNPPPRRFLTNWRSLVLELEIPPTTKSEKPKL